MIPDIRKPTWADDGTPGQITDPGAGKQGLGWIDNERPPFTKLNWWKNAVGQYLSATPLDVHRRNLQRGTFLGTAGVAGDYTGYPILMSDGNEPTMIAALSTFASNGQQLIFLSSRDRGRCWLPATPGIVESATEVGFWDGAWGTPGGGTFVLLSYDGKFWYSTDVQNWASVAAPVATPSAATLAFANGLFVATMSTATDIYVYTSPDGIAWTQRYTANVAESLGRAAFGNGLWFVPNLSNGNDLYSNDAITWNTIAAHHNLPSRVVRYSSETGKWVEYNGNKASTGVKVWSKVDPTAAGAWDDEVEGESDAGIPASPLRYVDDADQVSHSGEPGVLVCATDDAASLAPRGLLGLHRSRTSLRMDFVSFDAGEGPVANVSFHDVSLNHGQLCVVGGRTDGVNSEARGWSSLRVG